MSRSAVLELSQRPFALDGESAADCLDFRRTTVARGRRRNREQASALHSLPAPAPRLLRSRLRRPSGLTGGAAPTAATPLRRKPLLLFASPRELPNRTTIKELRWRQRPMRRQPRGDEHGPPSSGPMVNGVKTHMVNGRLIGSRAWRSARRRDLLWSDFSSTATLQTRAITATGPPPGGPWCSAPPDT